MLLIALFALIACSNAATLGGQPFLQTFQVTGRFAAGSLLGGVAIPAGTVFTFDATFQSDNCVIDAAPFYTCPVVCASFTINGQCYGVTIGATMLMLTMDGTTGQLGFSGIAPSNLQYAAAFPNAFWLIPPGPPPPPFTSATPFQNGPLAINPNQPSNVAITNCPGGLSFGANPFDASYIVPTGTLNSLGVVPISCQQVCTTGCGILME